MRERRFCDKHGVEWYSGDNPCKYCASESRVANRMALELSTPKTKDGRTWPQPKR